MARYHLDDLGWLQFEQLCQSLLKATAGLSIESWGGPADQGRDAYCPIAVQLKDGTSLAGPIVFQAKFVAGANGAGANARPSILNAVERECGKIQRRMESHAWEKVASYVLVTNVPPDNIIAEVDSRAA